MTLKENFLKWLRPQGIKYLKDIIKEHGNVLAVWMDGNIPHVVHFREGMQIRNWMREQPEFQDFDDHWFDNNWAEFTENCLKEQKNETV